MQGEPAVLVAIRARKLQEQRRRPSPARAAVMAFDETFGAPLLADADVAPTLASRDAVGRRGDLHAAGRVGRRDAARAVADPARHTDWDRSVARSSPWWRRGRTPGSPTWGKIELSSCRAKVRRGSWRIRTCSRARASCSGCWERAARTSRWTSPGRPSHPATGSCSAMPRSRTWPPDAQIAGDALFFAAARARRPRLRTRTSDHPRDRRLIARQLPPSTAAGRGAGLAVP